jgi:hypothetical protein
MNCHESKSIIFDLESLNLALVLDGSSVEEPRCPILLDGEVKILDPSLGSVSGNSGIEVSRIHKDFVVVCFEEGVEPVRAFVLEINVPVGVGLASSPGLDVAGNVEFSSHFVRVEISGQSIT